MKYLLLTNDYDCMEVSKKQFKLCEDTISFMGSYDSEEKQAFIPEEDFDRIKKEGFDWISKERKS